MLHVGHFKDFKYSPMFPPKFYGDDQSVRFLVMERLGCDLTQIDARGADRNRILSTIGLQMLDGLKIIHNKGFLFVDVKPGNFMLKKTSNGQAWDYDHVYFIDFGLVERFSASTSGLAHRPNVPRGIVVGTPAFASLAVHEGQCPARKDDIESMVHSLTYQYR